MTSMSRLLGGTALSLVIALTPVYAQENNSDQEAPQDGTQQNLDAQQEGDAVIELEVGAPTDPLAADIITAYQAYLQARQVALVENAEPAAFDQLAASRAALEQLCAEAGTPDLAACLDTFVPADLRVEGDLDPVAPLSAEASTQSESEAAAEEQSEPEPEAEPEAEVAPEPEAEPEPEAAPSPETRDEPEAERSDAEVTVESEEREVPRESVSEEDGASEQSEEAELAPVLDSAKDAETEASASSEAEGDTQAETRVAKDEPAQSAPPPATDEEAQAEAAPQEIESASAESGERVSEDEARAEAETQAASAPAEARIVDQQRDDSGLRVIFEFNNQLVVRNRDEQRLGRNATETYTERLRNGRTRETVVRQDGTQIITVYNRNGDILRRWRVEPDGSEYVLVYTPEEREQDLLNWRDPGEDLPPLQLRISLDDYVLEASRVDQRRVRDFLDQPPVERVQRLYSVDEVKRSARIRDTVRRLEIGDMTFATGSATLEPAQFGSLDVVAGAMLDLLDENPAEMFLIEGHTDAVGSDISNLALSDRRAETVAITLTEVFGVPPENLATQGYGERYLKIRTQDAERANRRVTIKRITPLVSPVANR